MKKVLVFILVITISLVILSSIIINKQHTNYLSDSQLTEIVKQEVSSYCDNLSSVATSRNQAGDFCPRATCKNEPVFNTSKTDIGYNVKATTELIYHWRNDMPGSNTLTFILDNKGNIISKDIPDANSACS